MFEDDPDEEGFLHPPATPRRPARRSEYIEKEREREREAGREGRASNYVRRLEEGFAMLEDNE